MTVKKALLVLLVIAVAAGVYSAYHRTEPTQLVKAWELLDPQRYRAMSVMDPVVSWASDSKSLIFAAHSMDDDIDRIYHWGVGDKKISVITRGASPNYVAPAEFVYLTPEPRAIQHMSLLDGKKTGILPQFTKLDFWPNVTALTYQPGKSVIFRLCEETRYYTPGSEEYDLTGKFIRTVPTRMSDSIMDFSNSPDRSRCALLVQEAANKLLSLQIARGDDNRGKVVARGLLGAVAWSPDGKTIAYADGSRVYAIQPDRPRPLTVAIVNRAKEPDDSRYVMRLVWSPDSRYLVAVVYVPWNGGDYPLIYVLDMSEVKWAS